MCNIETAITYAACHEHEFNIKTHKCRFNSHISIFSHFHLIWNRWLFFFSCIEWKDDEEEEEEKKTVNWCSFRANQLIYIEFFGQLHDQLCVFWTDFNVSIWSTAKKREIQFIFNQLSQFELFNYNHCNWKQSNKNALILFESSETIRFEHWIVSLKKEERPLAYFAGT